MNTLRIQSKIMTKHNNIDHCLGCIYWGIVHPESTNFFQIMLNNRNGKWSLWMNGKIIKQAAKEQTLINEVAKRGGEVSND